MSRVATAVWAWAQLRPAAWLRRWGMLALRLSVTLCLLYLVWDYLLGTAYDWQSMLAFDPSLSGAAIWLALALVPVNLGLEAYKWYLLVHRFYPAMTFGHACQRILAGSALGFVTPGRLGDYAGRVLAVPAQHRSQAMLATLICNLAQLAAALLAGAWAAFTLVWAQPLAQPGLPIALTTLAWLSGLAGLAVALGCLFPHLWLAPLRRLPRWRWLPMQDVPAAAAAIPFGLRSGVLALGLLRYSSYVVQFGAVLWAYGTGLGALQVLQFCGLLFVVKSLLPSIALAELGIREVLALAVAAWLGLPPVPIFNATLVIFAINLAFPALVGVLCLWRLRPTESPDVLTPSTPLPCAPGT